MNGVSASPRELIIKALKEHPEGLTITTISEVTKLHRHTVTKYVYELRGADIIYEREIGPARLCYLKEGLTKKNEKEVMKRLNGYNNKMKSSIGSLGQIQILAVIFFLLLAPAAVITANFTNYTGNDSINLEGYMVANNGGVTSNLSDQFMEELFSNITNQTGGDNETVNETLVNETFPEPPNITVNGTSNITEPINDTLNTTEPSNETLNLTEPTNGTEFPAPPGIVIFGISYPVPVNVSEDFMVHAEITSVNGTSENVTMGLEVPDTFDIDQLVWEIPLLGENTTATFEWIVKANECGSHALAVMAESDTDSDSKDFEVEVSCHLEGVIIEADTIQGCRGLEAC